MTIPLSTKSSTMIHRELCVYLACWGGKRNLLYSRPLGQRRVLQNRSRTQRQYATSTRTVCFSSTLLLIILTATEASSRQSNLHRAEGRIHPACQGAERY